MKTAKLTIGIISIVLFVFITFQSCAVGIGNALLENEDPSGSAGLFLAVCMLVAGIVGICTRKGKSGGYVAGAFYLFGGLIGIVNIGTFSDLKIWSILCFIFAAVFFFGNKSSQKEKDPPDDELSPTELLKLQKILIGNSTDSYILPEEQLYQMAQDRISGSMRIIKESTIIMENTNNIDTFFIRSNQIIDTYKEICQFEEFFPFDESPTQALIKSISERDVQMKCFLERYFKKVKQSTIDLENDSKMELYRKEHEMLKKHYSEISESNQEIIEIGFKNLLDT